MTTTTYTTRPHGRLNDGGTYEAQPPDWMVGDGDSSTYHDAVQDFSDSPVDSQAGWLELDATHPVEPIIGSQYLPAEVVAGSPDWEVVAQRLHVHYTCATDVHIFAQEENEDGFLVGGVYPAGTNVTNYTALSPTALAADEVLLHWAYLGMYDPVTTAFPVGLRIYDWWIETDVAPATTPVLPMLTPALTAVASDGEAVFE